MREITLRYPGQCYSCGQRMPRGIQALHASRGKVRHVDCADENAPASTVTIDGLEVTPIGDGLYRTRHGETVARTRHGLRQGYDATGRRCEDAPCCGCCS